MRTSVVHLLTLFASFFCWFLISVYIMDYKIVVFAISGIALIVMGIVTLILSREPTMRKYDELSLSISLIGLHLLVYTAGATVALVYIWVQFFIYFVLGVREER